MEQDFGLMFGDATSTKFLKKWPTVFKQKVVLQSHGLPPKTELRDLIHNAEFAAEVDKGTDIPLYTIILSSSMGMWEGEEF